jgi:hypothetical protein
MAENQSVYRSVKSDLFDNRVMERNEIRERQQRAPFALGKRSMDRPSNNKKATHENTAIDTNSERGHSPRLT